ncbi:hypothetical protein CDAR_182391 [Caerostris darwini]|uniref:Uncharacterized protein n=1 Tax=Caerostris darwini TaxID=1538125 RepID=A0AAV4U5K3_9ARAC|nr:hypothetical protein CDAR_182391 [Caerostris darwini]
MYEKDVSARTFPQLTWRHAESKHILVEPSLFTCARDADLGSRQRAKILGIVCHWDSGTTTAHGNRVGSPACVSIAIYATGARAWARASCARLWSSSTAQAGATSLRI